MINLTEEQFETLGELADKADNMLHATLLPVPPEIHIKGLRGGLVEIRNELRAMVVKLGNGEDPWEHSPPDPGSWGDQ